VSSILWEPEIFALAAVLDVSYGLVAALSRQTASMVEGRAAREQKDGQPHTCTAKTWHGPFLAELCLRR
jgi:hypothetical protein